MQFHYCTCHFRINTKLGVVTEWLELSEHIPTYLRWITRIIPTKKYALRKNCPQKKSITIFFRNANQYLTKTTGTRGYFFVGIFLVRIFHRTLRCNLVMADVCVFFILYELDTHEFLFIRIHNIRICMYIVCIIYIIILCNMST